MDDRQPIRLQKFYNLRRANDAYWFSTAGIFKKRAHIWCQLIIKSDFTIGINFSWYSRCTMSSGLLNNNLTYWKILYFWDKAGPALAIVYVVCLFVFLLHHKGYPYRISEFWVCRYFFKYRIFLSKITHYNRRKSGMSGRVGHKMAKEIIFSLWMAP